MIELERRELELVWVWLREAPSGQLQHIRRMRRLQRLDTLDLVKRCQRVLAEKRALRERVAAALGYEDWFTL